uniref:Uncharacterized protein n=1 Tax=Moniliophthora roreri TaxID=221103 RepID=A0A0W0FLK4_MONRR
MSNCSADSIPFCIITTKHAPYNDLDASQSSPPQRVTLGNRMSNWSWIAWLVAIPSTIASRCLNIPWNIQRKFIGYAFKRFILDFTKTGLLEKELDRQTETGSIFLHSVALDEQRLNDLLPPLPFLLQRATIPTLSIQLPLENTGQPTSSLSMKQAHLEFRILPPDELSFIVQKSLRALIHSYAASFAHEALSPQEGVPRQSSFPQLVDKEGTLVTMFIAIVDRVFHAIDFDASDTKITLIHPEIFTLALSVASIAGRTGSEPGHRRVTASGVTVTIYDRTAASNEECAFSDSVPRPIFSLGKDAVALELFQDTTEMNKLRISISAGVIGGALVSWQLSSLVQLCDVCLTHCSNSNAFKLSHPKDAGGLELEIDLDLGGVILLILPFDGYDEAGRITLDLDSFFADPSVPPTMPYGYLRIHLEDIQMHLTAQYLGSHPHLPYRLFCTVTINEFSVLGFRPFSDEYDEYSEQTVFPVIITDHFLLSHYLPEQIHRRPSPNPEEPFRLPNFRVVDWTEEELLWSEVDLSRWRAESPTDSPPSTNIALQLSVDHRFDFDSSPSLWKILDQVNITTMPLHVFIDLGQVLRPKVLSYLDEVFRALSYTTSCYHHWNTDPNEQRELQMRIHIPMVRFELRCSLSGLPTRSGALVVDVHQGLVSIIENSKSHIEEGDNTVLDIGASYVLVACSPGAGADIKACGIVSAGSLQCTDGSTETQYGAPWLGVARGAPAKLVFTLSIPSSLGRLTGETLDNLQYWTMDATHLLKSALHDDLEVHVIDEVDQDREQLNLSCVLAQVGRCFFARKEDEEVEEVEMENVINISADDALIRVLVPISDIEGTTVAVRVLDVVATSLDASVSYEGNDTLVNLNVKKIAVENRVSSTFSETILSVLPLDTGIPRLHQEQP